MLYNQRAVMVDIYENRRLRLRQLIEERFDNNQRRLARAVGLASTALRSALMGSSNLGEGAARQIEVKLGLPKDWMDREPPPGAVPKTPYKARIGKPPKVHALALQELLSTGASQTEIAERLGVHKSTVSRAVRNEHKHKRPQRVAA